MDQSTKEAINLYLSGVKKGNPESLDFALSCRFSDDAMSDTKISVKYA